MSIDNSIPVPMVTEKPTPKRPSIFEKESTFGYFLLAPMLIVVFGLIGYPFLLSLWFSVTDRLLASTDYSFVGLENYSKLLADPIFRRTLFNTFNYTVTAVVFKLLLGLILALTLREINRFRRVFRALFMLPWVVPSSLSVLAWVVMFDSQLSVITWFLKVTRLLGVLQTLGVVPMGDRIPWVGKPHLAMAAIQTVNIWRGIPFFAMIILAGLLTIPKDLYEAAEVDGANSWQKFWAVTLPHLTPVLIVVTLFSFVRTLGDFQIVWILTKGGPQNSTHLVATYSFLKAIRSADLGQGAAAAAFLFPFLSALIWLQLRYSQRE